MRRSIWISLLACLGLLTAGALLATPLAESRARAEAANRGLLLEMEDLKLGWFHVELSGVAVELEGVPNIKATMDRVVVDLSLTSPRIETILAEGGRIEINGEVDAVRAAVDKWRAMRPTPATSTGSGGPQRTELLRDFEVVWTDALGAGQRQTISGLQVERSDKGQRAGADLIELSLGALRTQIAGAEIQMATGGFDLAGAEKLGAAEMRVSWGSAPGPATARRSTPEDETTDEAPEAGDEGSNDDDRDSGSDKSGLGDRLERDDSRVAQLLGALALFRDTIFERLPPRSRVEKLWITYTRGDERLHVGPSLLTAEKKDQSFRVGITPQGNTKGTPLSFLLSLEPKEAPHAASLDLKGGPVSLRTLGINDGAFGLSGVAHTSVSGSFTAHLAQDGKTITGGGDALIEGLALQSAGLAENLVSFPRLAVAGKGQMQVDGSRYKLEDGSIRMGDTSFNAAFDVERGADYVSLKAAAEAPLVSCQALLDSAPRGLLGAAEQMRFDGTFSVHAGVEADTRDLAHMKATWDFKNGCKATAVPGALDPEQFRGSFTREVLGAGNIPMQIEFGPLSPSWVPYDEVSPFVEKALLVTEDGRFFRHDGFDNRAIESAIRDNVRKGTFVRGASTISMQLAKNLYLSRKKTLARKFQEAALTLLLEQNFEKRELLELYVNVVEFGPGIYGIRQAADHYFATVPGRLSATQAFFLASILPAPNRQYFEPEGTLKKSRLKQIHYLLGVSHKREGLTDTELADALKEEPMLGRAEAKVPGVHDDEGDALDPDASPHDGPTKDGTIRGHDAADKERGPKTKSNDPRPPEDDEPIFPKQRPQAPPPAPEPVP